MALRSGSLTIDQNGDGARAYVAATRARDADNDISHADLWAAPSLAEAASMRTAPHGS